LIQNKFGIKVFVVVVIENKKLDNREFIPGIRHRDPPPVLGSISPYNRKGSC
jgi:hypothetical protein